MDEIISNHIVKQISSKENNVFIRSVFEVDLDAILIQ